MGKEPFTKRSQNDSWGSNTSPWSPIEMSLLFLILILNFQSGLPVLYCRSRPPDQETTVRQYGILPDHQMRAIAIWLCIRDWLLLYWNCHIGWRPSLTWVMSSEGQRVPSRCNIDLGTDVEIIHSMVSYETKSKVQKFWYMDIEAFMRRFLKT